MGGSSGSLVAAAEYLRELPTLSLQGNGLAYADGLSGFRRIAQKIGNGLGPVIRFFQREIQASNSRMRLHMGCE